MSASDGYLSEIIDEFDQSWLSGDPLSIGNLLAMAGFPDDGNFTPDQREAFCELIKRDLEQRWGFTTDDPDASPRLIEAYLSEFSHVSLGDDELLELVEHEFCLRHQHGQGPEIEEYSRRFPRIADNAQRRLTNLRDDLLTESSIHSLFASRDARVTRRPADGAIVDGLAADSLSDSLAEVRPFSELSRHVREAVAMHAVLREFRAGDVLLRQGEAADSLFILLEGQAEVSLDDDQSVHSIARLEPQTVVCELGLVTQEVRSANVIAVTDGSAATIAKEDFEHIAGRYPRLSIALSELIAERVGTLTIDVLCGKSIGRYLIRRRLGRGAMGIVYEAGERRLDRRVALKMLRHDLTFDRMATQRFHQEAEIVRDMGHENIVQVYDEFSAYGTSFIAMEICDGPSLADIIAQAAPLDVEVVKAVVGQLAKGLTAAHAAGIAHRDLKPSNVLLTPQGTVKIADFGLARCLSDDAGMTAFGQIVGTPRYMAPEQLAGERGDPSADVYALGCIAYEMFTGQPMFPATRFGALLKERARWSMPPRVNIHRDLDDEFYGLLEEMLEEDPDARHPDLDAIARWAKPVDLAALNLETGPRPPTKVDATSETKLDGT